MEKFPLKGSKTIPLNPLVGGGGAGGSTKVGSTAVGGTSYQSVTRKVCVRESVKPKIAVSLAATDAFTSHHITLSLSRRTESDFVWCMNVD